MLQPLTFLICLLYWTKTNNIVPPTSRKNRKISLVLPLVADIQVEIGRLPLPHYSTIFSENKGGHHMTFGTKLQQIRKAAGLSQEQLADLINMSRQAISKWETDQAAPDITG